MTDEEFSEWCEFVMKEVGALPTPGSLLQLAELLNDVDPSAAASSRELATKMKAKLN